MRKVHILVLLIFLSGFGFAQNLIQNGNFDSTYQAQFGVTKAYFWDSPTIGNPDIFNPKSINLFSNPQNIIGYQQAKSGDTYMGLDAYRSNDLEFREYIQTKLNEMLKRDSIYCFQMYISLADSSTHALRNQLGVYFSATEINDGTRENLPFTPQIEFIDTTFFTEKEKWVLVEASYRADGNEEYIIIGNFRRDSLTDTIGIKGGQDPNHFAAYYYIDNVFLGDCDSLPVDTGVGIKEVVLRTKLELYPNPAHEYFYLKYKGQNQLSFNFYSILGNRIELKPERQGSNYQFSVAHLPKGVYFLNVVGIEGKTTFKVVKE